MKTVHQSMGRGPLLFRCALAASLGTASLIGYATFTQQSLAQDNPPVTPPAVETIRITADEEEEAASQDAASQQATERSRFWLGVMLRDVEGDLATYLGDIDGVFVDSVFPDSPAAKAGLVKGDVLLAIDGEELADPAAVMKSMRALTKAESDAPPKLSVAVLRKGQELNVEVQLEPRPERVANFGKLKIEVDADEDAAELTDAESMAKAFSFSWTGENGEELKALVEKMGDGLIDRELKLFRMGDPAMLVVPDQGATSFDSMQMVIKREVDGKQIKVTISRKDGQPATITVESEGETTEYSEEELEEMPEAIRNIVKPALQQTGNGIIRMNAKGGQFGLQIDAEKAAAQAKSFADKYRAMAEKQADVLRAKADELAKQARSRATTAAQEAEAAILQAEAALERNGRSEMLELRKLVDQLQAEVKELRQQLKKQD